MASNPPNAPTEPLDVDSFLDQHAPKAQDVDSFLDQHAPKSTLDQLGHAMAGPLWDSFASAHTPLGRTLSAFGQGVSTGWGSEPLSLSPETDEFLKKSGVFNDYQSGRTSIVRTFNEALMRPAAFALNTAIRGLSAVQLGAEAAAQQAGTEAGSPALGRDLAAVIESGGGLLGSPGSLHVVGGPEALLAENAAAGAREAINRAAVRALNPELVRSGNLIADARALNVIGPGGEAAWSGMREVPALSEAEAGEALKPNVEIAQEQAESAGTQPPSEFPPDVNAAARAIAPDVFNEYDALAAQRETYRQIVSDPTREIDEQIDNLRAQRLEGSRAERTALANQITELEDRRAEALEKGEDNIEVAAARARLQEIDYRMRDLAPDVAAAYRQAATGGVAAPVPVEPPPAPIQPAVAIPSEPAAVATPQQIDNITADVSQKLIAAGRPEEEANAAAALIAAHYQARAARFEGAKGTAEDIYSNEAPAIQTGPASRRDALGSFGLNESGKTVINLFKNSNAATFIHETGHQWLEELMADARDPAAPESLRTDGETVRIWLGMDKQGEFPDSVPTRAHERFARGFERYMMEGTAPSQALASVFAKFKSWLTQIYETVAKLRSPITDDIRRVFDRMLVTEGHEPVIVPEREGGFAAEHERLAETTPPGQAGAVADQIRAQADEVARTQAPEVHDELTGGRGQDSGNAPAGGEPGGNGNAPEPVAAAVGTAERPSAVGEGGIATAPERSHRAGAEQPVGANDTFTGPQSNLVDKAGNIRLDNLNTPEDVNQVLRDVAAQNGDFLPERRGVMPDAEVLSLADALGMDPSSLDARKIGQAFNAEQIVAARKLLIQSATNVRDLAIEATDEKSLLAFGQAIERHRMIQGQVSGITAEAGRALRAFRALEGGAEAREIGELIGGQSIEQTLFQLKRTAAQIAQLETPAEISGYVDTIKKPGFGAMALEVLTNWLISGPITHSVYMIGNRINLALRAAVETAFEAGAGMVREAITGEAPIQRATFGEIPSTYYAMLKGERDGWKALIRSAKTGQTIELPHEQVDLMTAAEREKYEQLRAAGASYDEAITQLGGTAGVNIPYTRTTAIPNFEIGGVPVPLGSIVRAPGERMVAPLHSYTRTIAYTTSIAQQAYRAAVSEELEGMAFAQRVEQLTREPTEEMMQAGRKAANDAALMGRGGKVTHSISAIVNHEVNLPFLGPTRPLRFIDPFTHVSGNIIEQAIIQRSPLGLATQQLRDDVFGRNGPAAQDSAIARQMLGVSLSGVAVGLAAEGLITPSEPSDPKEAAEWRLVHGQAHGFTVGNMIYDLSRLGPVGLQIGLAADLQHVASRIGKDDINSVLSLLAMSFGHTLLNDSALRGPSDLIKAIDEPDRYGTSYLRNFASSFIVPYSVGLSQIARQIDPFQREARTLMDSIKSKVPWWSETLFPRRAWDGTPLPNREFVGVYAQHLMNDPVNLAFERLGIAPAKLKRELRGVALTDQQYDDYARVSGDLARRLTNHTVAIPGFASMPEGTQRKLLDADITKARETGAAIILATNHTIISTAVEGKKSLITGPKAPKGGFVQPAPTVH